MYVICLLKQISRQSRDARVFVAYSSKANFTIGTEKVHLKKIGTFITYKLNKPGFILVLKAGLVLSRLQPAFLLLCLACGRR
jgi:hypothetical protein